MDRKWTRPFRLCAPHRACSRKGIVFAEVPCLQGRPFDKRYRLPQQPTMVVGSSRPPQQKGGDKDEDFCAWSNV